MNINDEFSLVVSLAGHDKGNFYVIIHREDEYVYLVDGKTKTVTKPKKKKTKHIRFTEYKADYLIINHEQQLLLDSEVRKAVKQLSALFKKQVTS